MNKFLALCCAAAGLVGFSATGAQAAQTVNTLPAVVHIDEEVIIVHHRHHRHHRHYRHGHYAYRHHRRVWVSNY